MSGPTPKAARSAGFAVVTRESIRVDNSAAWVVRNWCRWASALSAVSTAASTGSAAVVRHLASAVISGCPFRARYFARIGSGAVISIATIWLVAAVLALTADRRVLCSDRIASVD